MQQLALINLQIRMDVSGVKILLVVADTSLENSYLQQYRYLGFELVCTGPYLQIWDTAIWKIKAVFQACVGYYQQYFDHELGI